MRFKEFISEKFNPKTMAAKIVKELKTKDWGYSMEGGNGRAMVKGKQLVVQDGYYYGADKALADLVNRWSQGRDRNEADYFQKKYNIVFNIVKKNTSRIKPLYPGEDKGLVEIYIDIDGGEMSG